MEAQPSGTVGFSSLSDLVSHRDFLKPPTAAEAESPSSSSNASAVSNVETLKNILIELQEKVTHALQLISGSATATERGSSSPSIIPSRVIEGVFDGEHMIGSDGEEYAVPTNYASKSKLVEGDMLKLTITTGGAFIYKQVSPIERSHRIGILVRDGNGNFCVESDGKRWRVLAASISYYKSSIGDEVAFLIPEQAPSSWAAVENILKK